MGRNSGEEIISKGVMICEQVGNKNSNPDFAAVKKSGKNSKNDGKKSLNPDFAEQKMKKKSSKKCGIRNPNRSFGIQILS